MNSRPTLDTDLALTLTYRGPANPRGWRFFCFKFLDSVFQPFGQRRFQFIVVSVPIERINRFAGFIQFDKSARHFLLGGGRGDQLHKHTVRTIAWFRYGIEIQARRRILKNEMWTPRRTSGLPVSALLNEFQFRLQY